jgi:hypothetical protein
VVAVTLTLPAIERIDARRGAQSRGDYIESLLELDS